MSKKDPYLHNLLRAENTVFSPSDLALIWGETNLTKIHDRARYYIRNKQLYSPRKGFYTKDKSYEKNELASKIYTPSYISLYTVLNREGVIFQFYEGIYLLSYISRTIAVGQQKFFYRKIKDIVLSNASGIVNMDSYSIASKERAFLDMIYLSADFYFDNLNPIDWDKAFELAAIYQNKRLLKDLDNYYKDFKEDN